MEDHKVARMLLIRHEFGNPRISHGCQGRLPNQGAPLVVIALGQRVHVLGKIEVPASGPARAV